MKFDEGARLNARIEDQIQELQKFIGVRGACLHFSDIEGRLGVNPQGRNWSNHYFAPKGVYGYPITAGWINKLRKRINGYVEGEDRDFIHVFQATRLETLLDTAAYDAESYQRDFEILISDVPKQVADDMRFMYSWIPAFQKHPFQMLIECISYLSKKNALAMRRHLVRLGYSGILDSKSIITTDIPTQLVTFYPPILLFTLQNPLLLNT